MGEFGVLFFWDTVYNCTALISMEHKLIIVNDS